MKSFTALVSLAIVAIVAASPSPVEERQLGGLPSVVCLTGALADTLPTEISVVSCATGETCTALDIPIVGSLLPIGVSTLQDERVM